MCSLILSKRLTVKYPTILDTTYDNYISISVPRPRCLLSSGRVSVLLGSRALKSAMILCSRLWLGKSFKSGEI